MLDNDRWFVKITYIYHGVDIIELIFWLDFLILV